MKEASFYKKLEGGRVRCRLCRFNCLIGEGARGLCHVRENRGGVLYSLVYGRVCAEHVDPIEKKPLYHVLPGSQTYSVATVGCNFRCHHCQNADISQVGAEEAIRGGELTPAGVVARALQGQCLSISYTYTEPTIYYEFAFDCAKLAVDAGLKNIFVTNGYINREPLLEIAPYLHAANIDLKGFSEEFYRTVAGARLEAVLDSIIAFHQAGIWVEITTLLIPGWNDSEKELQEMASFIVTHLGVDTPWHLSAFFPTYKMTDRPPTPASTLLRAAEIGRAAGLRYVYVGNLASSAIGETRCPHCAALLLQRRGFSLVLSRLKEGGCPDCGCKVAGVALDRS